LELPENVIHWKILKFLRLGKDEFLNIWNTVITDKDRLKESLRTDSRTCCSELVNSDQVAQGFIQMDGENLPFISTNSKNRKAIRISKTLSLLVSSNLTGKLNLQNSANEAEWSPHEMESSFSQ